MISNERPSSPRQQPDSPPKPLVPEYTLKSELMQIEHKSIMFTLKENPRGRYLRLTEKTGDRFSNLIIPSTGLEEFKQLLNDMVEASNERPFPFNPGTQVQPGPPLCEHTLKSGQAQIERKNFTFTLEENPRGRYLRLTEKAGGRFSDLIIPSSGLEEFKRLLDDMVEASNKRPFPFNPVTQFQPKKLANGEILKSVLIHIERKSFSLVLKENHRGRYLRLTERSGDRYTGVIIPSDGLEAFKNLLDEMAKASNERPSPFNPGTQPQPPVSEDTLKSGQMQVDDRTFTFMLQKNAGGRFLRLTEEAPGYYPNSLVIPASGLEEYKRLLNDMVKTSNELPLKNLPET